MNNFQTRTLSGALFVAIIIASILVHQLLFISVFTILSVLTILEFQNLANHQKEVEVTPFIPALGAVILSVTSYLFASGIFKYPGFSFYALFLVFAMVFELYRNKKNPMDNLAHFILGQVFVAIPFALLNFIIFVNGFQPLILLAVFVIIWVNDSAAYVFGVTFGKHRLFERVSPKKSWEGLIGGALFSLLAGYVFSKFNTELSLIQWLIFASIVVVFGTYGDLLESLMKRTVHVKDSGNAIPGHGGFLDRFDSMLLVAPAIYIYLSLLFR